MNYLINFIVVLYGDQYAHEKNLLEIEKLEKDVYDLTNELKTVNDKYQKQLSVSNNYKIELERQNEELTKLYNSESSSKKKTKKTEENQF